MKEAELRDRIADHIEVLENGLVLYTQFIRNKGVY